MYDHAIVLDTILPFAPTSRRGLIVDYDAASQSFIIKPELRAWLKTRPYSMSYQKMDNGGFEMKLQFLNHADMLLFKLTWGGR